MKSQKGIALTSLIIYVIAMLIVISIISVISTFFYNNIEEVGENVDPSKEFTQFNTYFLQDINRDEIEVIECKNDESSNQNYIILSDGTQYTFKNQSVYRGKVKICENIYQMSFEYTKEENQKGVVNVKYKLTEQDTEEKSEKFTLLN